MNKTEYPRIGETVYDTVLPNGLPIYVVKKPGYRKKFAMFATNYGGVDRRFTLGGKTIDTPAGVAHYLEHKMFDTPDGDALMMLNATGASPNAFTSENMTAYHFECTECFEENLRILLSFVSVPYFTEQSVAKEQGIIGQEIRMTEDNPDHAIYTNLMKCLYAEGPLRDSVAGTVESIAEITPEILYNCHKVFYHPSNMVLVVVGDVDPDMIERTTAEVLPPEPAEVPGRDYGMDDDIAPASPRFETHMEVSAPQFYIGMKLGRMPRGPESTRARLCNTLALRCLCGSSSPFYLRLYDKGLLNSTFGCSIDYAADRGLASFGGESPDPDAVMAELSAEIQRIKENGFDPDFFERQRRAAYGGRLRALSSFEGLCVSFADAQFAGYRLLDVFEVAETIRREDVEQWLREHLFPEHFAISIILPKEN